MRHRLEISAYVVQDGRRVLLYGPGGAVAVGANTAAYSDTVGPVCQKDAWGLPWDPQPGVTYQIVLVTKATVKDTPDSSGEPWTARAEKLVPVTC